MSRHVCVCVVTSNPTIFCKARRSEIRNVFLHSHPEYRFDHSPRTVVRPRSANQTRDFSRTLAVMDLLVVWHAGACGLTL